MQPGTLLTAIPSTMPDKASMLFTIGAKTNKRYALALLDDTSTFLEISGKMLAEITLDVAHVTGYPAAGYGTCNTGQKINKGRHLQPIGPKDIKEWLAKATTTKAIDMIKSLKKTKAFENWVQGAALAKTNEPGFSQVQVTASPINPKDIPKEVWDKFRSDVEDKKVNCPEYTDSIKLIFEQFYTPEVSTAEDRTPPPPLPKAGAPHP